MSAAKVAWSARSGRFMIQEWVSAKIGIVAYIAANRLRAKQLSRAGFCRSALRVTQEKLADMGV